MSDMPPAHTPPTHTPPGIGAAKRWYYALGALQVAIFVVVALAWFVTFPRVHIAWFGSVLFAVTLLLRYLDKRKVVCPSCRTPLVGQFGLYSVDLHAKACEHYSHPFR